MTAQEFKKVQSISDAVYNFYYDMKKMSRGQLDNAYMGMALKIMRTCNELNNITE